MAKLDYEFNVADSDVKKQIQKALESMLLEDRVLNQRYDATKMDQCYSWLVEQIKEAYIKCNGKKSGGIDISNEQCVMACRHYFLEELWKYVKDKPKEKRELTPEETTANIVKKPKKEVKKEEPNDNSGTQLNIFDMI